MQAITIALLVLGTIANIANTTYTSICSIVLSAISSIAFIASSLISLFAQTSYEYEFETKNWEQITPSQYKLYIKESLHGLGPKVQLQIFEKNGNKYEEITTENNVDKDGDITIMSSTPFTGKVNIQ